MPVIDHYVLAGLSILVLHQASLETRGEVDRAHTKEEGHDHSPRRPRQDLKRDPVEDEEGDQAHDLTHRLRLRRRR